MVFGDTTALNPPTNPPAPFQPLTADALAQQILSQTQATGFEGYTDAVYSYIEKCSSAAIDKYAKHQPPGDIVNVRHPLEEYFYRTMSPYAYKQLQAIRKDKKPIGPIASQSATEILGMCNELSVIGARESARFERELNKPQWGPSATINQTQ